MRDYFDLWFIGQYIDVDSTKFEAAIRATFDRRKTEVDPEPPGLTGEYGHNAAWNRQWSVLLRTNNLDAPSLEETCRQCPGRNDHRALQGRGDPSFGAPWRRTADVEVATLERVHWFNHQRLLEPSGYNPPTEYEQAYFQRQGQAAA